jgi:hypothetical protein
MEFAKKTWYNVVNTLIWRVQMINYSEITPYIKKLAKALGIGF